MNNKETRNDKRIVGISAIMKVTGMTRTEILHHIEKGNIHSSKEKERFVFGHDEMLRLKVLNKTHTGLWQIVRELQKDDAKHVKAKFKRELLEFASENNWFGAKPISANNVYFSSIKGEEYFLNMIDAKIIQDKISLWINSFGCSSAEKLKLLLNRMSVEHPRTSKLLNTFFEDNKADKIPAWKLTDYLCSKLKCEITDMSDEMIEDMISAMDTELQLNTARIFSEFLAYLKEHKYTNSNWSYNFLSRSKIENNDAYPMQAFQRMAYIIFNEGSWSKRNLLEKALSSKKYTDLWLYISLHFICGWRGTDILRLPMPLLHLKGEKIRKLIKENKFDSIALLDEVEFRLKYAVMKPGKTECHTNIPHLKLFVPESLRKPISLILSAAASWNESKSPGEQFVRCSYEIEDIEKFFGFEFVLLCNNKRFSTRRANKAYLQGIEMIADNSNPGKPKGYMLAALARSHKGGLGRLPETTEIYLKDANFSGYTPEFIAKEMFERGVFSFIPYLMLEMYSGEAYKKLHVSSQTSLIADMGIKPSGLENMTKTVEASLFKARNIISKIMNHPEDIRGTTAEILQNIASGNAASKQEGCMCLLTAANFSCIYPDRESCVGCGYEIYTKAILQSLIREYKRLIEKKKNSSDEESTRCSKILKSAIMPAIIEIIISIRNLNPDYDISPMLEKMKGGYPYA
jgi:hypothetical protein